MQEKILRITATTIIVGVDTAKDEHWARIGHLEKPVFSPSGGEVIPKFLRNTLDFCKNASKRPKLSPKQPCMGENAHAATRLYAICGARLSFRNVA